MSAEHGVSLAEIVVLLAAAVVSAALFKRLGLGAVLGYIAAGVAIGPFGFRAITEPAAMLHAAELGVVLFLFVIGLEMQPGKLWQMRGQIFGLGTAQVGLCAIVLATVGIVTGYPVSASFVAGAGFVLTSTAVVMQMLEERGERVTPAGQRIVSILLLEDLMIVPLLALVSFLAPIAPGTESFSGSIHWKSVVIGASAIVGLVVVGHYLLDRMFALLARIRAREAMTAAALLVVLGAAYVMEVGGLSMAMGAFVAGVLLSRSVYRHQLESDIEPFRSLLLGLFFLAIGMSLQLDVVAENWRTVLFYVFAYMFFKAVVIYLVARLFGASSHEAAERMLLMAQGGEFAFVLYAAATQAGILTAQQNAVLSAIIIVSMVLTPLLVGTAGLLRSTGRSVEERRQGPDGSGGRAVVVGFGRVGQIASQYLFARGHAVSIIDTDVEMIDVATDFGFKVFYGDGTRLSVLRAAGMEDAEVALVCVDSPTDAILITSLIKSEFPATRLIVRANDRRHRLALAEAGAHEQVRETFESALVIGQPALRILGEPAADIERLTTTLRARDDRRLALEKAGGTEAGRRYFTDKPVEEATPDPAPTDPSSPAAQG